VRKVRSGGGGGDAGRLNWGSQAGSRGGEQVSPIGSAEYESRGVSGRIRFCCGGMHVKVYMLVYASPVAASLGPGRWERHVQGITKWLCTGGCEVADFKTCRWCWRTATSHNSMIFGWGGVTGVGGCAEAKGSLQEENEGRQE
jgi:hypothetical protein